MKKILVLTDLSDVATHAAYSAVPLCAKLQANIILLHSRVPMPVLTEYPNNYPDFSDLLYSEHSKEKLIYLKEELTGQIRLLDPDAHQATIDWEQEDGSIADLAESRLKKGDVELIVMGASAGTRIDHLFLGSDTMEVMNKTNRPVLVVPAGKGLEQINKVTFASDFNDGDVSAIHYLTRLGRKFHFQLEIAHVVIFGQDDSEAHDRKRRFQQHVAKFNYPGITYTDIYGKDLTNRLHQLCHDNGSDLLVLSHDQHSFWNRVFKGTHSGDVLKNQDLPVLFIPAVLGNGTL